MSDRRPSINVTTPKGVAIWPRLKSPDTKYNSAGVYSLKLRFSPGTKEADAMAAKAQQVLDDMVEWVKGDLESRIESAKNGAKRKAIQEKLDNLKVADLPIRDHEDDEGEPTGDLVILAKMVAKFEDKDGNTRTRAPIIMDGKNNEIPHDAINIGGGSEVRAKVTLAGYFNEKDAEVGVTIRLRAVKVYKLVEFGSADMSDWGEDEDEDEGEDLTSRIQQKSADKGSSDGSGSDTDDDADF